LESTGDEVLRLLQDSGLRPRGIQHDAIDAGLLLGSNLMVVSPTGSGKTLVGEMALLRGVIEGKNGLFLVPLKALAVQIAETLRERYEASGIRVGLSTGDFQSDASEISGCDIVVTTYERADSLLRRKAEWLQGLGVVVIDEIQMLSEAERGARLEGAIIRLRREVDGLQIIALSATVGAPDEIAEWLGCQLVQSAERPVPLFCKILTCRNKRKTLAQVVMTTVQDDGQALVFTRTRKESESLGAALAQDIGRQFTNEEKQNLDRDLDSIENWAVNIPENLRPLLSNGAAFHHAGLNYRTRDMIERMFRRGLIRVLFATTTLSAGVDLPARAVILTSTRSPANHREILSANLVHQMLGRAGRPGKDRIGFGVILTGSEGETQHIQTNYFEESLRVLGKDESLVPKYERIDSALTQSGALAEQLLVLLDHANEATLQEIEEIILSESYLGFCGVRDSHSPMRLFDMGEVTAESAIEQHALSDTIRAARKGALGSVDVREGSDKVVGGIVVDWDKRQISCRFSADISVDGNAEGPQCSCGFAVDASGILCPHLVALGVAAAKKYGSLADYVVPISLGETSPSGILTRLGLIEGGQSMGYRPTPLGRIVSRMYLSISTAKEMLALLPTVQSSQDLLWLLKHLVSIETGSDVDDAFEDLIAGLASTDIPIPILARNSDIPEGDAYVLVETSRWLLSAINAISEQGGLKKPKEISAYLIDSIEARLEQDTKKQDESDE
jgi:superfamily II DNA/RNA helicase